MQAGVGPSRAAAGLTAANLLVFAVVLAMPVLAVPAIVRGVVPRSLLEATLAGLGVFVVLFALARCCSRATARLPGSGARCSGCATGCGAARRR